MAPWWLRSTTDEDDTNGDAAGAPPDERADPSAGEEAAGAARELAGDPEGRADREPEVEREGEDGDDEREERGGARRRSRGRRRGGRRAATDEAEDSGRSAPESEKAADKGSQRDPDKKDTQDSRHQIRSPRREQRRGEELSQKLSPDEEEQAGREIVVSIPERQASVNDELKIALFCDFENIALGVRDSEIKKFDVDLVLERLLDKGKIIVKKAYADWERYNEYKRQMHEAAFELIDIPQKYYSGKNSADIKMVVDAMDLCYSKEHLDTFVVMSGDSDFSPLVSKLKENNKTVIGLGVKNSSSQLLIGNCDEFIYYEDIWRDTKKTPHLDGLNKKQTEVFQIMIDAMLALIRQNKDVLWGSMIKQTMQRKKPSFNEGYYGYSTFSELLEDAERNNIIKLKKDQRSGTYIVTGFAGRK